MSEEGANKKGANLLLQPTCTVKACRCLPLNQFTLQNEPLNGCVCVLFSVCVLRVWDFCVHVSFITPNSDHKILAKAIARQFTLHNEPGWL